MISRQGGDWNASMMKYAECPYVDVTSSQKGFLADIHARDVAIATMEAGAGRMVETDAIDHAAGVVFFVEPGQAIESGQPLARVYASNQDKLASLERTVSATLQITTAPVEQEPPVVIEIWNS